MGMRTRTRTPAYPTRDPRGFPNPCYSLHLVMAVANSLHKQYLGTSTGTGGLRHAFDNLNRKGLISQSTKGPFWHHLDEAIKHISEAHFRAAWIETANVKSLTELKSKSPIQLKEPSNLQDQV
jgi:hypothetical protein